MDVDFHIHTRHSRDSGMEPLQVVRRARARGLDAVAVCDHGTIAGALEAAAAGVLPVIVGSEVRTAEGEIIGLFLTEDVPAGLTPEETLQRMKAQGAVVVVPHPFDRWRRSKLSLDALSRIANEIDAVEVLNGRNLTPADDDAARAWAAAAGAGMVGGSDAHTYREIGCIRTTLPEFSDAASLRRSLPHASVAGRRSSPLVHVATAVRKRLS